MTIPTALQQGRFELRYELGRDGCGVLFLALDRRMADREVALRRLNDAVPQALMEQVARLSHPTLPAVYDLFEEQGQRYLVLEHAAGQRWADIVLGPPLQAPVVLAWGRQLAEGLSYLHHQRPPVIHGDVRPPNVVLHDGRQIKLIGGTPGGCHSAAPSHYSSPELWQGAPPSAADDVYAFAATLHHLLSGVDPNSQALHSFVPLSQRRSDVAPVLAEALARALSADPARRPPTIDALMKALDAAQKVESAPLPAIGLTPSVLPAEGATIAIPRSRPTPTSTDEPTAFGDYAQPLFEPELEYAEAPNPGYAAPRVRQPAAPRRQQQGGSGPLLLGLGLGLLVVLLLGFFLLRALNWSSSGTPPTAPVAGGLPTITRDEGRPLTALDLTQTAQALFPATSIPTLDPNENGAPQTALAATATQVSSNLATLYQGGVAAQEAGRLNEALVNYEAILIIDPNYLDTAQRRETVLNLIEATSTAVSGTAIAGTATASVPTATPTLPPPTPTPEDQALGDQFEGAALDLNLWTVTLPPSTTMVVTDGQLHLSASDAECFPLVEPLSTTVTYPTGDYDFEVGFSYETVTALGTGIVLSTEAPTACGGDRTGTTWFGVWQDESSGLVIDFHRSAVEGGEPLKDIRVPYTQGQSDTNSHTLLVQVRADVATFFLDDNQLFEERVSGPPRSLWFGNPALSPLPGPWSNLAIERVVLRRRP